jgi:hypothetical protein
LSVDKNSVVGSFRREGTFALIVLLCLGHAPLLAGWPRLPPAHARLYSGYGRSDNTTSRDL